MTERPTIDDFLKWVPEPADHERRVRVAKAIMRVIANGEVEPKGKWLEAADAAIQAAMRP